MEILGSRRWPQAIAVAALVVLAACGGGGGAGGGGSTDSPPEPQLSVSGRLTRLAADGSIVNAAAGETVDLVAVDDQAAPGVSLATTQTTADGQFRLDLPGGRMVGEGMAFVASDGAGGRWRALLTQRETDLGPASEAFTQEFVDAISARGWPSTESLDRLARFQHNSTLALRLMAPNTAAPDQAVARLRTWLRADPAATEALTLLQVTGRLPSTLGDIGGFLGVAQGAWDVVDSDGRHRLAMTRAATGEWNSFDTREGASPGEPARIRLEADGATLLSVPEVDVASQLLNQFIGPHVDASFALESDSELLLTSIDKATTGYDFDGDNREDRVVYRVTQTRRGIEKVSALGETGEALRIDFRVELSLALSGGGSVSAVESRRQWSRPFAGVVRVESSATGIDERGQTTTVTFQRVAERAVMNDVSWPGRVRVTSTPVAEPSAYMFPTPLALTADLNLTFGGAVSSPVCCYTDNGLSARDLAGNAAAKNIVVAHGSAGSRVFASPDGTKLYVALNKALPEDTWNLSRDLAAATSHGATIVRYDARSLEEEARIDLPPRPSELFPDQAYARNYIWHIVVSDRDPNDFLVQSYDALVVRGTAVQPRTLNASVEAMASSSQARLLDFQVRIRAWDGALNEAWVEMPGAGPLQRVVPVVADGFDGTAMREGVPVLWNLIQAVDDMSFDRIAADRAYLQGFRTAIDTTSGTVVRRLADSPEFEVGASLCTGYGAGVLCTNSDYLFFMDKDLAEVRRVRLHNDLRMDAKGFVPSGPDQRVFAPSQDRLVYLGYDLRGGSGTSKAAISFHF